MPTPPLLHNFGKPFMLKPLLVPVLLLAIASSAFAQTATTPVAPVAQPATAPQLTAAQKAQMEKQNAQMAAASLQIAQMVDQNQIGQVWDNASSVAKQANTRAEFVQMISADRAKLGALKSRQLASIARVQSTGGALPAGLYLNVNYATQFANAKQPVRELISYYLDKDNVWRVSGYTVR